MTKKAIIIEDELAGYNNLKNMLATYCSDVEIIGHASSVAEGTFLLRQPAVKPDVAFLDINLPDGLVFKLLDKIGTIDFKLIFVTAYDSFAMKACEYSCLGYITKPIDPDKLVRAVGHYSPTSLTTNEHLKVFQSHYQERPSRFHRMIFPSQEGDYFVTIKDIVYLKADDNCTNFYLKNGKRIFVGKNIGKYDTLLQPYNFFRVHKGYMVNLHYVEKYVKGEGGTLILANNIEIPVSKRRKPFFREFLKRFHMS